MPGELQREVLGEDAASDPAAERPQPMETAQAGQEAAPGPLPATSSFIPCPEHEARDKILPRLRGQSILPMPVRMQA